jgi:amino acid adenylation domain-containing protein
MNMQTFHTFLDVLKARKEENPTKIAFTFLEDGEEKEKNITYYELYEQVLALAALLQEQDVRQKSVLLLFHSGLEYIVAFLATLQAGAIAVPAYPPKNNKNLERFSSIIEDCNPITILSTIAVQEHARPIFATLPILKKLHWVSTDNISIDDSSLWEPPYLSGDDIAFLQYTSGSTGSAKGVMVSHRNLLHNEKMIQNALASTSNDIGGAWLPIFHDMGLIGMVLQPLYVGFRVIFMAPTSFIQKPIRWLNMLSRYQATITVAPNFGLELCSKSILSEDCQHLDLSHLRFLMCGAEPINPNTVMAFNKLLQPFGWNEEAFKPAFGLAESTLMVTATKSSQHYTIDTLDMTYLQEGILFNENDENSIHIISSGTAADELDVRIANTKSNTQCADMTIGEIIVAGDSVAKGYWNNPIATQETFGYMIEDYDGKSVGPFMRTGDLGYLHDGKLHIAGRTKDLIIIAGKNHYPQDIEWSVENALANEDSNNRFIQIGGCAAFSIKHDGNEKLVVVAEITRNFMNDLKHSRGPLTELDATNLIRRQIARVHQLQVHDILLIKPTTLPKTSSGKVQRHKVHQMYSANELQIATISGTSNVKETAVTINDITNSSLILWLQETCSTLLDVSSDSIKSNEDLAFYGLSSINAMRLHGMLEDHTQRQLPQELMWEAQTIEEIANAVLGHNHVAKTSQTPLISISMDQHEPFTLNAIQEAYWLGRSEDFEMGGVGCHLYIEFEQEGLDSEKLQDSWQRIVQRHAMLRAIIDENGNQRVLQNVPDYHIENEDISTLSKSQKHERIEQIRSHMSHKTYDASVWPLFEIKTTQINPKITRIHFSYDLLIGDVWSLKLLHEEWGEVYLNPQVALEPIQISFRDYTLAQKNRKEHIDYKNALEYWNDKIPTIPQAPKLPEGKIPSSISKPTFSRREKQLDEKIWSKLKRKAQTLGITPSALLCSAYADILSAWSQSRHFTLNLTLFNRENIHPDVVKLVGDFTTLLLLEVDNRHFDSFKDRTLRLQESLRKDLVYKAVNGITVMQKIAQCQGRNAASMPIVFTSALGFDEMMDAKHPDWLGKPVHSISQTPQVWLDHQVREEHGALLYTWDSVDELFAPNVIDEMFTTYTRLLELLVNSDTAWDDTMMCLTPGEQTSQFRSYFPTQTLTHATLYTKFLEQVNLNPNNIALIGASGKCTYQELYEQAQNISAILDNKGVKKGSLIAIVMEKGIEQAIAALGILFYGCAYVPIDASTPSDRIEMLMKLCASSIILTQSRLELQHEKNKTIIYVDALENIATPQYEYDEATANDLAYVIFTSGSTGVPKGVMIDHKGATNTIDDINERFKITDEDRFLSVSSFAFDLSIYDLFGTLSVGATLIYPDPYMGIDPNHYSQLMNEHSITLWNSAPAVMQTFLEYVQANPSTVSSSLKTVLLSGDWINPSMPSMIRSLYKNAQVISLGGATEASIWSVIYPTNETNPYCKSIPYGKALKNQGIFILGDKLEPRPTWVSGEIFIAGEGLALGYYQDEQKTNEKFIYHPITGVRLYKTGDLGRVLPDGNIEFLGRKDFQVKISGYRIELGEIEHVIQQYPSVHFNLAATYKDPNGVLRIGAYIVPKFEISKISTSIPCQEITSKKNMTIIAIQTNILTIHDAPTSWIAGKKSKIRFNLPGKEEITSAITILSRNGKNIQARIDEERKSLYFNDYFFQELRTVDTDRILALKPRNGYNDSTNIPCDIHAKLIDHDHESPLNICALAPDYLEATTQDNLILGDEVLIVFKPFSLDSNIELRGKITSIDGEKLLLELKPSTAHEDILENELLYWIKTNKLWQEDFNDLISHLHQQLPDYMVPKALCTLNHLPLTCNGKIDRNLLPEFKPITQQKTDENLTATQIKLIETWKEILGNNELSVDDNFFDIGGYSQLAVRLLLKVKEVFQVEIPIRELFSSPTIRALAQMIDQVSKQSNITTYDVSEDKLYATYARQGIGERIATIRADKYYTKAYGTTLEYSEDGQIKTVLDMVGGYGSTILGHNHPQLIEHMIHHMNILTPTHTQHTNNVPAGKIAQKLSDLLGRKNKKSYISTLGSTGTEATEAAIKHAKMAHFSKVKRHTKNNKNFFALLGDSYKKGNITLSDGLYIYASLKLSTTINSFEELVLSILEFNHTVYEKEPKFIVLNHAFHGMTSGAISLTASTDFKKPFHWMELNIQRIAHTAIALETAIDESLHTTYELGIDTNGAITIVPKTWLTIAGMFIEPIQGEGGIFVLDKTFAQNAREIATKHHFPLIIDEIQCGMGRSGTFCASEQLDIEGDYYLFSKSLGGGVSKISAMAVEASQYEKDFGYYHGSTFAEDQISAYMALKTLEIIENDNILMMVREKGEMFATQLRTLQQKYPTVFKEVRGMGLMLGIELSNLQNSESFLFRALANGGMEVLNHLIAGYLLNVRHIRIAPTKTRNTIRFLPSAYITLQEINSVVSSLEEIAQIILHANAGRLLSYTVGDGFDYTAAVKDYRLLHPSYRNDSDEGCAKVAHVGHIEDEEMLVKAEPSLMEVDPKQHEALLEVLFPVSKVTITQSITVSSNTGEKVNLKIIGIPLTGKQIEEMMKDGSKNILLDRIDEAVEMAYHEGCTMVGMGGYTSIVTLNCTTAATTDIALTSGNGFTTALGIEGVEQLAKKRGLDIAKSTVGIVGAKGNIGSICASIMAEKCESLILIGRHAHDEKLLEIAEQLRVSVGNTFPISISDSYDDLGQCDIIITATNAAIPVIFPHHLSKKTKIICDIATPNDVDVSVSTQCPWIDLILGGLAKVPNTTVNLHGTRLPENHVYGCVAETMLLGLEGVEHNFSFGVMSSEHVKSIGSASKKHGFELGLLKSIDLYGHHNETALITEEIV